MTGEPAQFIKGKTIQEQMMQILKMLRQQASDIQDQIDDLQRQIDDIGLQSITPIIDGTYAAGRAVADESGNDIEDTYETIGNAAATYATQSALSSGLTAKADKATSLAGYGITDGVTTNTAQDITAQKTFKPSGNDVVLAMQNTDSSGSAPSANKFNVIRYNDTSETEQGRMDFYHLTTGTKAMRMRVKGQDGTDHSVVLNAQTGGDGFVTAPYRAYNSANTGDVVTIGSLAANPSVIHATGNEFKTGDLSIGAGASYLTLQGSVSNQIARILKHNGVTNNVAFLDIRILNDNTAQLVLCKNIGGTETSTVIATL